MNDRARISHKTLLLTSLLVLVLASSLFAGIFMNYSSGAFLDNVVHVKNEAELKNAVGNASSKELIIALDNDIILAESAFTIPYNKDITLTSNRSSGFYKLISGISSGATIYVDGGVLKLDGVIVSGGGSSGIHVINNGVFVMYDGEISNNTAYTYGGFNPFGYVGVGGGVGIDSGVFELYGGKISNNYAQGYGGGVDLGLGGAVFKMYGGEISGNTAGTGG
ncbi:MAG: hypothetical protein LBI09_03005, partial [Nitrososphaerota archaeon]|nr:hypothetical protein [Nitrososphaerota archaeon]